MGSEVSADTGGFRAGGDRTDDVLALVERVVLGWPGVWKKRDEDGPGGVGVTGYRLGRKQIGHVHDDGHADFRFPREVRDELIRTGRPGHPTTGRRRHCRHGASTSCGRPWQADWRSGGPGPAAGGACRR